MNACLSSLEEVVALWRERKERTPCQNQYCAPFLARCTFAPFTSFGCLLGLKLGHGFFKINLKKWPGPGPGQPTQDHKTRGHRNAQNSYSYCCRSGFRGFRPDRYANSYRWRICLNNTLNFFFQGCSLLLASRLRREQQLVVALWY
jgi:hypothetical protein